MLSTVTARKSSTAVAVVANVLLCSKWMSMTRGQLSLLSCMAGEQVAALASLADSNRRWYAAHTDGLSSAAWQRMSVLHKEMAAE